MTLAVATTATTMICSSVNAQSGAGYYTDPATGIVYQKVTKTVERPVVETKTETRDQTIYRPQTVTETRPESRTVYTPVVEYKWEPRVHGRWNPFQKPTVAYHHVPNARWEARNQVVERTNTRTEWVAEKRTIEVPQQVVRIEREQKVDYEPVGRVSPQQQASPPGADSAIASRLRPLNSSTRVESFGQPSQFASTVGRMTSDPPRRSTGQGGLRPTNLYPGALGVQGQALPPVGAGVGVANLPSIPFFR
jgi:hypothetical protein